MPQPEKPQPLKVTENHDFQKTPDKFKNSPQDLKNKITAAIDKAVRLVTALEETLKKDQALPKGKGLPETWVTDARNHGKAIEKVITELKIHLRSVDDSTDNKNKVAEKTLAQLNNLIHKASEDPLDRPNTTWREFVRWEKDKAGRELFKNPNNPENLVAVYTGLGMEKNGNKETRYLLDANGKKIMKVEKSGDRMFVTKYTKGKPGEAVGYKFTADKDGKWQITKTGGDGNPEKLASVEIKTNTNTDKYVANLKAALNKLEPGEVVTAELIGTKGGKRILTLAKNEDGTIQTLNPDGSPVSYFDINNPKTLGIIRATLAQSEFKIEPESKEMRMAKEIARKTKEFEKALRELQPGYQLIVGNGNNEGGNAFITKNPKTKILTVETSAYIKDYDPKKINPKEFIRPNSTFKFEPRNQTA